MLLGPYLGGNRMLDALPAGERTGIARSVELVMLASGEITHDPGRAYGYVDFPLDAVLSVVNTLTNGDTCEVGTIGREGASGIEIAFGAAVFRTTFCQVPGRAARMRSETFLRTIDHSRAFAHLTQRVTQARLFCIEQLVACNALHSITERCARWMLSTHDRVGTDTYELTHDFLSIMLGVRRASVTRAAENLQDLGSITYHRGRVMVLDRAKLEAAACECYAVMANVYEQSVNFIDDAAWSAAGSSETHVRQAPDSA